MISAYIMTKIHLYKDYLVLSVNVYYSRALCFLGLPRAAVSCSFLAVLGCYLILMRKCLLLPWSLFFLPNSSRFKRKRKAKPLALLLPLAVPWTTVALIPGKGICFAFSSVMLQSQISLKLCCSNSVSITEFISSSRSHVRHLLISPEVHPNCRTAEMALLLEDFNA